MKVIHLVTEDCYGAGRAAIRISESLSKKIESKVFVLRKKGNTDTYEINYKSISYFLKRIKQKINEEYVKNLYPKELFHIERYGNNIDFLIEEEKPDIIHFHYLNDGLFSDKLINSIIRKKIPIVWTLHDMWSFTGGCHYDNYCGKYLKDCQDCPQIDKKKNVVCKRLVEKARLFKAAQIQFVGCSNWITEQYNNSFIGKYATKRCITIHNPISEKKDNNIIRKKEEKIIILFGAVNAINDTRKGFNYLEKAVKYLDKSKYKIVYFGSEEELKDKLCIESKSLGYINDDEVLYEAYKMADVFVAPSLQENLANTVLESLSAGTPVVAFDIGGMSDMIVDGFNGYLAKPFDEKDFADKLGRASILKDNAKGIKEDINIRFSNELISQQYLSVYNNINNDLKGN